jgi:hypothetical protein
MIEKRKVQKARVIVLPFLLTQARGNILSQASGTDKSGAVIQLPIPENDGLSRFTDALELPTFSSQARSRMFCTEPGLRCLRVAATAVEREAPCGADLLVRHRRLAALAEGAFPEDLRFHGLHANTTTARGYGPCTRNPSPLCSARIESAVRSRAGAKITTDEVTRALRLETIRLSKAPLQFAIIYYFPN